MNKHIDFTAIFTDLYEEHKLDLIQHRYEADHFNGIIEFVENGGLNSFDIQTEECEFCDKYIQFTFGFTTDDANESNTQSSFSYYVIVFDRILHEFTSCEYEQG